MSEATDPASVEVVVEGECGGNCAMVRRIGNSISLRVVEEPGGAVAGIFLTDEQAVRLTQAIWGAHHPPQNVSDLL